MVLIVMRARILTTPTRMKEMMDISPLIEMRLLDIGLLRLTILMFMLRNKGKCRETLRILFLITRNLILLFLRER